MKYRGLPEFQHGTRAKIGLLITNLGTPDAATPQAVRRYLAQFLSDPRVIEFPRLLWKIVLHGILLRIRPTKVAHAYGTIWTAQGSPLLTISRQQVSAIEKTLDTHYPGQIAVALGMRYGAPSIAQALQRLYAEPIDRLLVLPLYPQYSATTTASTLDAVSQELATWRWVPALRMITSYHDHPAYIQALTHGIRDYWTHHGKPQRLLISFHGLPERYLRAGDPYYCQCQKTGRLLVEQLALPQDQYTIAFQSRFGREPWLQPYADQTLVHWAKTGITDVDVICPGFSADCLETLEEIAIQNKQAFLTAGGKRFRYIPALNDQTEHIQGIVELISSNLSGWLDEQLTQDARQQGKYAESTRQRAIALGAKQ